jgi:hypothetical protein
MGFLGRHANASARNNEANEIALNFMLSVIKRIKPKDEVEAMLAVQMAAVYMAMMSYRTGGEQKVTVQHVSVSEGGQAIVGNVTQARPRNVVEKIDAPCPQALTHAKASPMPIIDESKEPASIPGSRARKK